MKNISRVAILVLSASMLASCGGGDKTCNVTVTQVGPEASSEVVLTVEPTSAGLVFERDLDGEGFTVKDYVGKSSYVIIPEKFENKPVKRIKEFAFRDKKLTRLEIPGTIEDIGDFAFIDNPDFNQIDVKNNDKFFVKDKALYRYATGDKINTRLIYVYPSLVGQFVVDEKVSGINFGAFQSTGLTIVNLNANLLMKHFHYYFGVNMEAIPTNMREVVITAGDVAPYTFAGVPSLSSVVIYDSVAKDAYEQIIPNKIGENAFKDCSELTSVLLPDTLTEIGANAFANCSKLAYVRVGNSNAPKLAKLGNDAFLNCDKLVPNLIDNVKYLGNPELPALIAFGVKDKLAKSVNLADDTKFIATGAFKDMVNVTGFALGQKLEVINDKAFLNCAKLKQFSLPDTVKTLGIRVFEGTQVAANSATLSDGAYYLSNSRDELALIDVSANASTVGIKSGVKWLDYYAVNKNAAGLKKFTVNDDAYYVSDDYKVLMSADKKTVYAAAKAVSIASEDIDLGRVTDVKDYAFYKSTITAFKMPSKMVNIGEGAFSAFDDDEPASKNFILPETVRRVGKDAFKVIKTFDKFELNDGIEVLEDGAISGATNLEGELFFPSTLVRVGSDVFKGSGFTTIKVEAEEAPATWSSTWFGDFNEEAIIYDAARV